MSIAEPWRREQRRRLVGRQGVLLADALLATRQLKGPSLPADVLAPYLAAIRPLAEEEIGRAVSDGVFATNARAVELAVLGTVLWEPVLIAFRRLWHEHLTTQLVRLRGRA